MKRAKILVVDLNPSDRLGDDLRTIIESQVDVEEVKIWDEIGTDLAATDCGKTLAHVIPRSNPSLIFLVNLRIGCGTHGSYFIHPKLRF